MYQKIVAISFFLLFLFGYGLQTSSANNTLPKSTKNAVWAKIVKSGSHFSVKQLRLVGNEINYQASNIYAGEYYGKVVSVSGKSLCYFPAYELSAIVFWDNFDPKARVRGGSKAMENAEIELRIPHFSEGKTVQLYDPRGKLLLAIDISSVR